MGEAEGGVKDGVQFSDLGEWANYSDINSDRVSERRLFGGGDNELSCGYDEFDVSLSMLLAASSNNKNNKRKAHTNNEKMYYLT